MKSKRDARGGPVLDLVYVSHIFQGVVTSVGRSHSGSYNSFEGLKQISNGVWFIYLMKRLFTYNYILRH